ncbi:hypothetical protein [Nocardia asteroides]
MSAMLDAHAMTIDGIEISIDVIMPGSPIAQAQGAAENAVLGAYRALSSNVRHMAEVTQTSANSYADVDFWFSEQVRKLDGGS